MWGILPRRHLPVEPEPNPPPRAYSPIWRGNSSKMDCPSTPPKRRYSTVTARGGEFTIQGEAVQCQHPRHHHPRAGVTAHLRRPDSGHSGGNGPTGESGIREAQASPQGRVPASNLDWWRTTHWSGTQPSMRRRAGPLTSNCCTQQTPYKSCTCVNCCKCAGGRQRNGESGMPAPCASLEYISTENE